MASRGSHDGPDVLVRNSVPTVLAADLTIAPSASSTPVTIPYALEPHYDRLAIIGSALPDSGSPVLNIEVEIAVDGVTFDPKIVVGTVPDLLGATTGTQSTIVNLSSLLTPGTSAIRVTLTNTSGSIGFTEVNMKAVFENPFRPSTGAP